MLGNGKLLKNDRIDVNIIAGAVAVTAAVIAKNNYTNKKNEQ